MGKVVNDGSGAFTLQKFGIEMTKNEYLALKLHDGVFSDANKPYFFTNNPNARMRTSIVNVLHSADFLASKVEYLSLIHI